MRPFSRSAVLVLLAAALVPLSQLVWLRAARHPDPAGLSDADFLAHLDARIPERMRAGRVPGVAVLVVKGGEELARRAYGHADLERRHPLTTEAVMMTHSLSKPVTAWGVMRLVEQGRIGLDDPVGRHLRTWRLPPSPFDGEGVTVRRLLSHTAGMPLGELGVHHAPGSAVPPLRRSLAGAGARPVREPGAAFAYSNAGYAVLELLVEDVTGRGFAEYMGDEVLRPLGMRGASFAWRPEVAARVPTGYDLRGRAVPPFLYPNRASGGLFATLGDVGRFAAATVAPPSAGGGAPAVLSPGARRQMHTPQVSVPGLFGLVTDGYGLGHFVETLPSGHAAVWHGGQGLGWMTHLHAVPATGDAIVILSNSQRSWPLIAAVLDDWSRWRGIGPVGMARIVPAQAALRTVVGWLLLASAWLAWRLVRRTPRSCAGRIAALAASLALMAALGWALAQEYLFLSSLFPTGSLWLGGSLLLLALALLAWAGVPRVRVSGAGLRPRRGTEA